MPVTEVDAQGFDSVVSRRLDPRVSANAQTRHLVVDQLRRWGLEGSTVDDVALTTHELVANALVHGTPPVDVRLVNMPSLLPPLLLVEVHDRSPERPVRRMVGVDEEHGRGLQVVEALAAAWGVRVGPEQKIVWASHVVAPTEH